jgi:tRNA modification GTPase
MTRDILLSVEGLITDINQHLSDNRRGQRLREGAYVALVGPPNVGKSTLLNLLARREAAIVAATAGTTRDVIEVHLDLSGLPVTVADTAGLREAAGDEIEAEGVRRARERAERADLRVLVADATAPGEAAALLALWPDGTRAVGTLVVANKCDLLAGAPPPREIGGLPALAVSLRTGRGVGSLLAAIEDRVRDLLGDGSGLYLTRERHRQALEGCRDALARAVAGLKVAAPPELAAEDLRLAVRALGRITGQVDVEELLDVIFRDFCIGK